MGEGAGALDDRPDAPALDRPSATMPPSPRRWATAAACATGIALAAPEWLPQAWKREDGPVEFATFGCFLVGGVLAVGAARRLRFDRKLSLASLALGVLLFVAAGEEISWGQRQLGIETPSVLVDGNTQDELNLHNVEGLQESAILAQLAIVAVGLLLPRFVRRPWARAGVPFFAGYLAYRVGRGLAALTDLGAAGRNSEAAELMLALGLLAIAYWLAKDGPATPEPTTT